MRALALTMVLLSLTGCPDDKASSGTEPAHPLLVAKCRAGTKSACTELDTLCEDGDEAACTARKKLGSERSIPMRNPESPGAPPGSTK